VQGPGCAPRRGLRRGPGRGHGGASRGATVVGRGLLGGQAEGTAGQGHARRVEGPARGAAQGEEGRRGEAHHGLDGRQQPSTGDPH
jgi:hypothetical protein